MEPGAIAGRELFIPVPHQRGSAADTTAALIAQSGWVWEADSAEDVPGFNACSVHGAVLQEERKTCNGELELGVLFWG